MSVLRIDRSRPSWSNIRPIDRGLVFWGASRGGTSALYDLTANQNNGTLNGGIGVPVAGPVSGMMALDFDGTDDYVTLPAHPTDLAPNGAVDWSCTGWYKQDANGGMHIVSNNGNSGAFGFSVHLANTFSTSHKLKFSIASSSSANVSVSLPVTYHRTVGWVFFAATYSAGSTFMSLTTKGGTEQYVENTSAPSSQYNQTAYGAPKIGARGQLAGSVYFQGQISDVRIYNRALSANEVNDLYTQTAPDPQYRVTPATEFDSQLIELDLGPKIDDGLVFWGAGPGEGDQLVNLSPYDNHGTLTNMEHGDWVSSIVPGIPALDLDGSNETVLVVSNPELATLDRVTISAWIKTTSTGAIEHIVTRDRTPSDRVWQFRKNGSDKLEFIPFAAGGGNSSIAGSVDLSDGVWHHCVATWDSNTIAVYVDGLLDNSTAYAGTLVQKTKPTYIGRSETSSPGYFNGLIADVQIYDHALTLGEIQELRQRSLVGYVNTQIIPVASAPAHLTQLVTYDKVDHDLRMEQNHPIDEGLVFWGAVKK